MEAWQGSPRSKNIATKFSDHRLRAAKRASAWMWSIRCMCQCLSLCCVGLSVCLCACVYNALPTSVCASVCALVRVWVADCMCCAIVHGSACGCVYEGVNQQILYNITLHPTLSLWITPLLTSNYFLYIHTYKDIYLYILILYKSLEKFTRAT